MTFRAIAFLIVIVSVSFAEPTWPTWRGDPQLSGRSAAELTLPIEKKWQYLSDDGFTGTPVGGDGRIFVCTWKGKVIALDLAGKEKWVKQLTHEGADGKSANTKCSTPLTLVGDVLVACSSTGRIYGLSAKDGKSLWTYDASESVQGAPALWGDKIIVLTQATGELHCIDSKDGSEIWVTEPEARADGHPSVVKGNVVYGNCNSMLLFVDCETGIERDRIEFGKGHEIAGTPAGLAERIVVGTRAGELMCVDAAARKLLWRRDLESGELFRAPSLSGDKALVATEYGELFCFAAEKKLWKYKSPGTLGVPVIAGSYAAIIADGRLRILSLKDGAEADSAGCAESDYPPSVIDRMIIVAGDDSSIHGFGNKEAK